MLYMMSFCWCVGDVTNIQIIDVSSQVWFWTLDGFVTHHGRWCDVKWIKVNGGDTFSGMIWDVGGP